MNDLIKKKPGIRLNERSEVKPLRYSREFLDARAALEKIRRLFF